MTDSITTHTAVPIATEDDARATCDSLESVVDRIETLTVVHVIEKTDGYPDKAPLEARRAQADLIFSIVEERFADGPAIRRELRYGTDVVDEIVAAAADVDATAVGFRPRPGGRLRRLLSGSASYRLITECERPVVVFSRLDSNDD